MVLVPINGFIIIYGDDINRLAADVVVDDNSLGRSVTVYDDAGDRASTDEVPNGESGGEEERHL